MGPVVALGFVGIGQTCENHSHFGMFGGLYSFVDPFLRGAVGGNAVAPGVGHLQTLCGFHGRGSLEAVDMGGAAALEPGLHGKFADEGHSVFLI